MRISALVMAAVLASPAALGAQWLNYPTPGVPRLPDGSANLKARAPKLADGTPDLAGIWAAMWERLESELPAESYRALSELQHR